MSETVRSFTRGTAAHARRRRFGCMPLPLFAVLIFLLVWAAWTTRDRQPMHELVPAQQNYRIFINDFLNKRSQIAQSQVWGLVPEDSLLAQLPAQLSSNFGMPEWVLNNLIYGTCLLSGQDVQGLSDVLLISRMSRVGCLAEKLHRIVPGIERDAAGGLQLRRINDASLYYAVRGRVLLASPSRDALIRALTLTPDHAQDPQLLRQQLEGMGGEDLSAHLRLRPEDPLGSFFLEISLALRLAPAEAQLHGRGVLQPAWHDQVREALGPITPATLRPAPSGLVSLSANFGHPIPEVWTALNEAWPQPWALHHQLFGWIDTREGAGAALQQMLAGLLPQTGPAWGMSWHGIDRYAIVPTPEVVAVLQADPASMEQVFQTWPRPPDGVTPWDSVPRYDAGRQVIYLPMPGAPALEPTAAIYGSGLLISSSRLVAEKVLSQPVPTGALQTKGNLYFEAFPPETVEAVVEAGREFVHFGALRGHTS